VKARVFQLHTGEHDAVQGILPWFVNGTLDASQAQRVRDHLADCVQCRADLAWQQRLRAAAPHEAPSGAAHVADRQWAALARRIASDPNGTPREAARARAPTRLPWWPLALGAQTAIVAMLAIAWFAAPPREQRFQALGAAPSAASANVLVVFRPTATEADIRRALRAGHAQLVAGPTVTDGYLLRMEPLTAQALARLRADGVVLRVDSLEARVP
jgi:anti-sigma factor RsiW